MIATVQRWLGFTIRMFDVVLFWGSKRTRVFITLDGGTVGQWDCGRDPKLWGWVRGLVGGCCWWWWWVSSRFVFWASWKLQPRCVFTSFFLRHFITTLPFPFSGFVQKRREWGLGGEKWATEFVHGCLLLST